MAPRITCVISSLGSGGAERVISRLANAWAADGRHVEIVTLESAQAAPFYPLDPAVVLRPLGVAAASKGLGEAILGNLRRLVALRRAIQASQPDVVLAFTDVTNVRVLMALLGTRLPVIVSERVDPSQHSIGRVWNFLRDRFYPRADVLVVQSERAARFFPRLAAQLRVIPNPVVLPEVAARPRAEGPRQLVSLGRLHEQKGFDRLFRAFAQVAERHPNWRLTIWGEGPERSALEQLRDALGLQARVALPGNTTAPYERLAEADLFVMSSRYEGFPNALCEALAIGLPAVSFDCASGPAEIIAHGESGWLVPPGDVDQLAAALDRLMGDAALRQHLAANAMRVRDTYALPKVLAMWDDAIRAAQERAALR